MRYRPLAHQPMTLSAISLKLDDSRQRGMAEWAALGMAALECGINCFEIAGRSPALIDGISQALRTVDRRLVFLAWRFGPNAMPAQHIHSAYSASGMEGLAKAVIGRTSMGYLDLVQLDDPDQQDLPADGLAALKQLQAAGLVRMIGIAGEGDEIDVYISTGQFDLLSTPFNMLSGWRDRRRIKAAGDRNMSVIGYAPYPETLLAVAEAAKPKRGLLSWIKRNDSITQEPYAFLHATPDWSCEQISVAYALTEPGLASVQIEPRDVEHLRELAAVAERDLPAGIPAQIEMSRFSEGSNARHA